MNAVARHARQSMNLAKGAIMGFVIESVPRILDNGLLQE